MGNDPAKMSMENASTAAWTGDLDAVRKELDKGFDPNTLVRARSLPSQLKSVSGENSHPEMPLGSPTLLLSSWSALPDFLLSFCCCQHSTGPSLTDAMIAIASNNNSRLPPQPVTSLLALCHLASCSGALLTKYCRSCGDTPGQDVSVSVASPFVGIDQ